MTIEGQGVISRRAGEPALLEDIILDAPGSGEVLVKIQASGVCHTDLHYKLGKIGDEFPYLLGHEGAGVIEQVGEGVTTLKKGDYVVLAWRAPCGHCRFCAIGQPHLCAASLNAEPRMRAKKDGLVLSPSLGIGTFCTHTVVSAKQAIPMPSECPPEQASLIGCGVMTGVGAALYTAGVTRGSSVAVFGCGGVGCSVIQGAKLARAEQIIAVDIAENKLEWAREFGATDTVNAKNGDPVEQIKELTGGNGVNFVFEAVGAPETLLQALWSRDLAGTAVLIGVPDPQMVMELPIQQFFGLGGALKVSWYGDCLPSRDFPLLANWYKSGELDLDRMVTRTIGLGDTEAAFEAMERGETLRSVISL
ncbi:MAG: alcohol dehydrogenase catalytic domain-containing protein [Nitrospinaceae bacterium]|nr:alcohol dehydrogenase catalytic domain-containing protein [Nitrospinaceae bacterium]MBT3435474.1 alcohol dehydrogenase catalytic domain-containing protein [Nitrospinaceae bacterium]MBT3820708.1 alcohol dehydrogenase catalytic domain-containing protein [Nitrospinaceae bacterium]MBT4430535.1 alcohol dehydrogenase catalytic domain-containing protein [Nitrospinaceae bacterium]MBT5369360.1 alcohol dehydrogenase catalytic domain-containing protein [Nitrospinaceae bacterium]